MALTHVPVTQGFFCKSIVNGKAKDCIYGYAEYGTVFGTTVSPLGLGSRSQLSPKVDLVLDASAGMGVFHRNIPVPAARQLNVVIDWGGAFEYAMRADAALQIGYKFHHISNAYTNAHNPGVDANLFYVGWRTRHATRLKPSTIPEHIGEWNVAPFTGLGTRARIGDAGGSTPGVKLFTSGIQFSTPVIRTNNLLVSYNGNASPLVVVKGVPSRGGEDTLPLRSGESRTRKLLETRTAMGATFSPLGLAFSRANPGDVDFVLSGSMGGGFFTRPLPDPAATRLKVALEWGPRVDFRLAPNRTLQTGVKLYRLWSSFARGPNPRLDATVFYVGFKTD